MSITLCRADEIPSGEIKRIELNDGRELAVYRVGDDFHATDDLCTHGEAMLSEGTLEGYEVVCPFHQGMFDIRTGEATAAPCSLALRCYPVRVENGDLLID